MGHTPYGYKIENGVAVIIDEQAEKIRKLYRNYLSGMSLDQAAVEAGIDVFHASAKRLMQNRHYLGDDFYPAIIDQVTFDMAKLEWLNRTKPRQPSQGHAAKPITVPTRFHLLPAKQHFENPKQQAEYLYSLLESEEF